MYNQEVVVDPTKLPKMFRRLFLTKKKTNAIISKYGQTIYEKKISCDA